MKLSSVGRLLCLLTLTLAVSLSGVFAIWQYVAESIPSVDGIMTPTLGVYELAEGVHITKASVNAELTTGTGEVLSFEKTSLQTAVDTSAGEVTLDITIVNNTLYPQYFHGVVYDEAAYPNSQITYTLTGLQVGQALTARDGDALDSVRFQMVLSGVTEMPVLQFEFLPTAPDIGGGSDPTDPSDPVVVGAAGKFKEILNNEQDLQVLLTQMDNYSGNNRANSSYVGNVVGSSSNDTSVLKSLFTEGDVNYLTLDLDGEGGNDPVNVTAMIKRENVDGRTTGDADGNEMVLYLTAEDPSQATAPASPSQWMSVNYQPVTVYVLVFTTNKSGDWVQIGDMYQGIADANAYSGWGGQDSFNTDTWLLNDTSVYGYALPSLVRSGWSYTYEGTDLSTVIQEGYMNDGTKYEDIING
ncbi:MAG: hypothetical protein IJY42_04065 [Clostridia bacterium]|nr:hypothetical protein [Clostridia bacterium]